MSDLPVVAPKVRVDRQRAKHSLDSLDEFIDRAEADAKRLAEQGDLLGLGDGLERLRAIKRKLGDLERVVEDLTVPLMPRKFVIEDGLGMERKPGGIDRRNWQSEDLLRHLVGDQLVNPETGENVYETLLACVPFTGSMQWRTGALKARGVDTADWCEETPGRKGVRVWRPEEKDGS